MEAAAKKLVLLAAAMAALVVLAQAMETGRCRRQLRGQWPDQCEQHLMESVMRYGQRTRGSSSEYELDDEMNQGMHFNQCCQELRMMDPQCQCEAMERMVEQMRTSQRERMSQRPMDMAMELPMMCGTMQHRCRMSYMM